MLGQRRRRWRVLGTNSLLCKATSYSIDMAFQLYNSLDGGSESVVFRHDVDLACVRLLFKFSNRSLHCVHSWHEPFTSG